MATINEMLAAVAACQEIADAHLPDQPATSPLSEYEWAIQHIKNLRRAAAAAIGQLNPSKDSHHD